MKVLVDLEDLRDTLYEKDMITMGGLKIINSYLYKANQIIKLFQLKNGPVINVLFVEQE